MTFRAGILRQAQDERKLKERRGITIAEMRRGDACVAPTKA